jgi:glycosyltransferase involved in cell wall biosynthesis
MYIVFTAGREVDYPRNSQNIRALNTQYQVSLLEAKSSRLGNRLLKVGGRLLMQRFSRFDMCFIGFYGQPLVFPVRLRSRIPIILDAFVSTYDTFCFDRKIFKPRSLPGRLSFYLDRFSCMLADTIILDTKAQVQYFEKTFGIPHEKLQVLYVGCDDELFHPIDVITTSRPIVLFYGTFLPLHGLDIILKAAHLLTGENISFLIIGKGQEYERIHKLATELDLGNVIFQDPIPLQELPEVIARSTICLGGHFGRSEKAGRVIAGKTFQCLAMGRPTIVGDNPANRELFTHAQDVWMCSMADPVALANSILLLLGSPDMCARLGKEGRDTIQRTCGNAMTAQSLLAIMDKVASAHGLPRTDS